MDDERDEAIENLQEQIDAGYEPDEIGTVDQAIEANRDAEGEDIRDQVREVGREGNIKGQA